MNKYDESFLNLLEHPLDKYQNEVLHTTKNAVIAAGAGSGKTQVLATRFAWLVITGQANVDEILTLTFTNKAASEMYQRIYDTLKKFESYELSKKALENFTNAHIQTLDSYCSTIVRQCANRYGIKPDFSAGSADCERDVKDKAFVYILQHAKSPSVQAFAKPGQLQNFAEKTFADIILKYTSLATEQGFFIKKLAVQTKKITQSWNDLIIGKVEGSIYKINDNIDKSVNKYDKKTTPEQNDYLKLLKLLSAKVTELCTNSKITLEDVINNTKSLQSQITLVTEILKIVKKVPAKKGYISEIRPLVKVFKDKIDYFDSISSFVKQYSTLVDLNTLLDDFLNQINYSKRISGNLTFADVTELALKILLENEDIRNQEKSAYKKIMIDEFQDNNGKNRDLLYLLSIKKGEFENNGNYKIEVTDEKPLHDLIIIKDKDGKIIEDKRDPEKLFFMGDEKQSIYKFRGADVSVFNELTSGGENLLIPMTYNYRSTPELVKAFNVIFNKDNGIFTDYSDEKNVVEYEAYYKKDAEKKDMELPELTAKNVPIHAITINETLFEDKKEDFIPAVEQIAYWTARKIFELGHEKKNWSDFAILDRSRTSRVSFIKYLNMFGIPYILDAQNNIFTEAVVNDFYNYLRICVYPSDINSFAAYLCSPFCGLGVNAAEVVLSHFSKLSEDDEIIKSELSPSDYKKYTTARAYYDESKTVVLQQPLTTTLSKLWNDKGYKYETMKNHQTQLCAEHFDMLFELARQADEEGHNAAWFIDQLGILKANYSSEDADLDTKDVSYPLERESAVQIMTIHKSKGLQFKHVFVFGITKYSQRGDKNPYFYDDENGVSIKPEDGIANYFVTIQKELAQKMELAEFRRLIYVAITRAKNDVYLLCNFETPQNSNSIFRLFENIFAQKYLSYAEQGFPFVPETGFDFTEIEPVKYSELSYSEKIEFDYKKLEAGFESNSIKLINYECNPVPRNTPSGLEPAFTGAEKEDCDSGEKYEISEDTLKDTKFSAADFGTLAHSYLEMAAKGISPEDYEPEPKLFKALSDAEIAENKKECIKFCKEFASSKMGVLFAESKNAGRFFRAEWGFRMFLEGTIFTGSIDLIFENADGTYTIVDYKSDNCIDPEKYAAQQNCYRTAASKLLKVSEEKISINLYYLKHKEIVKL